MRLVRSVPVALLAALVLASGASAHDEAEPNHRDTPADLRDANIQRTLALAQLATTTAPDLPQYMPGTWCGTRLTTDDTEFAAFPASQRQIKVVYAYAAGEQDRSPQWSDALQADVSTIQQYLALQTGGRRALRFDMGTECGPQYVDIQVVALPQSRAYYRDDPTQFNRLAHDVAVALGPLAGPRDVFILGDQLTDDDVWGIAQVLGDDSPGASNATNQGGLTAIMWTNPSTQPDPVSWWQPTVMLHEITHNLGGVQHSAPHMTPGWHCWDGEDVMCYDDGSLTPPQHYQNTFCTTGTGTIPQTYDCGHDDYFNPDPTPGSYLDTHWNVYRSDFFAPCGQLGMACGDGVVPAPPVNTSAPAVAGNAAIGSVLTATAGTWLNNPASYAVRWQRDSGGGWVSIAGATKAGYVPTAADAGASLRALVTATNSDGASAAGSAPTALVGDPSALPPAASTRTPTAPTPRTKATVHRVTITLRDGARHARGTLKVTIARVPAGREVRVPATKLALGAGTWRVRLCAGPKRSSMRCALGSRTRARKRTVLLPAAKVAIRGTSGAVRVSAALVDGRQRVRANGSAASTP